MMGSLFSRITGGIGPTERVETRNGVRLLRCFGEHYAQLCPQ
jgi:hypothetical protein